MFYTLHQLEYRKISVASFAKTWSESGKILRCALWCPGLWLITSIQTFQHATWLKARDWIQTVQKVEIEGTNLKFNQCGKYKLKFVYIINKWLNDCSRAIWNKNKHSIMFQRLCTRHTGKWNFVRLWKTNFLCWFIPNYTWNHLSTYTFQTGKNVNEI